MRARLDLQRRLGSIAATGAATNDAFKMCPDQMSCPQADRANELLKSSHSQALEANIAFGIGVAAAIGAGVLWLSGAPDEENPRRVSVVPSVVPGETGVVVMGRF